MRAVPLAGLVDELGCVLDVRRLLSRPDVVRDQKEARLLHVDVHASVDRVEDRLHRADLVLPGQLVAEIELVRFPDCGERPGEVTGAAGDAIDVTSESERR
ncbi:MAG TPA: hypothetical protein VFV99_03825 [Kofleriaceae bacterium]|nr:hypothetical protein [Kofleriaceae bacterium]